MLAQRYNLGNQLYPGLSRPPNMQLQLALAAAQNPLLFPVLAQNLSGQPGLLTQQLLSATRGTRDDPPTGAGCGGGGGCGGNLLAMNAGNILGSLSSGAPAPVTLVAASAAAAAGMRQAAYIPTAHAGTAVAAAASQIASRGQTSSTVYINDLPAPPKIPVARSPRCKLLYVPSDNESVNAYQCKSASLLAFV